MIEAGDNLPETITSGLNAAGLVLQDGDVLCLAQKIVSKAEGQLVALSDIDPGPEAIELAERTDKDPRLVELILRESTEVVRTKPGVLIVRHRLGLVGAHAGIDQSNIPHGEGEDEYALLLPEEPDASAAKIRGALEAASGARIGVVITDSSNRPWRLGTIGCAIGCSGIQVLDDQCGGTDLFGRELKVTLINRADAIATAATLIMGETTEMTPVVIVRGLPLDQADETAASCIRPLDEDMFR